MKISLIVFAMIIAFAATTHAVSAPYHWDNGPTLASYQSALRMSSSVNADDFMVKFPTALKSVQVAVAPYINADAFSGKLSAAFFEHNGDRPGSLIASVNGSPSIQPTKCLRPDIP